MVEQAWGEPRAEADGLSVWLRAPIRPPPAAGAGTALFVHGAAVHRSRRPVRRIELVAGGEPATAMAAGMPSPTLAAELGTPGAGRAIFWGIVHAGAGGRPSSELVAKLEGGASARVSLGPATGAGAAGAGRRGRRPAAGRRDLHGDLRAAAASCSSASSSRCGRRRTPTGSA